MTTPNTTARFTDSKSSPMHQLEQMKEWEVLIDLREATDYNEWTNNICGWDELEVHQDPSLCDGIESNENGAVVRVDLRSSGLQGTTIIIGQQFIERSIFWFWPRSHPNKLKQVIFLGEVMAQ
jgi:hypothetical protein